MKRYFKALFFYLVIAAAGLFTNTIQAQTKPKAAPQPQAAAEEQEPEYSEEEYDAYDKAVNEPDLSKKATLLLEFKTKYPQSKLMPHINSAYENMLFDNFSAEKWDILEPLAEQWLKAHPGDQKSLKYIAVAAEKLGHDQRCVECLEELYTLQPSGSNAYNILQTYRRMKNLAKELEWAEKVLTFPEFAGDFELPYTFVHRYSESKNLAKAADWAHRTLKAVEQAKNLDATAQDKLRVVRRNCYHVIGENNFNNKKFDNALKSFQQAISIEKYGDGYYFIGRCQWEQKEIDEAMLSFAKANILGGSFTTKAWESCEQLYKSIHNNTTVGIDKIKKKAKEELNLK
jgi:hypothetical protein